MDMEDTIHELPRSPAPPPGRGAFARALYWLRDLFLAVIIAVVVILFLYRPVKVEGTSMMPALRDQERIFINQFVYMFGLKDVQRYDMVVFWYPGDPTKSYIKRVIGLPGDLVDVQQGVVSINGGVLPEEYVPDEYRDRNSMTPQRIAPGQYFVMGDHRSSSNDSRAWGSVPRRYIYGKAVFVYWPLDKLGVLR